MMIQPKHIALQNIAENSEGKLVFYMYVELEHGILALEVVQNALEVICSNHHEFTPINLGEYCVLYRAANRSMLVMWMELLLYFLWVFQHLPSVLAQPTLSATMTCLLPLLLSHY